jgi:hypothetical protein
MGGEPFAGCSEALKGRSCRLVRSALRTVSAGEPLERELELLVDELDELAVDGLADELGDELALGGDGFGDSRLELIVDRRGHGGDCDASRAPARAPVPSENGAPTRTTADARRPRGSLRKPASLSGNGVTERRRSRTYPAWGYHA